MKDREINIREFAWRSEKVFGINVPNKKTEGGKREFLCPEENMFELAYYLSLGILDFSFLPENVRQNIEPLQDAGLSGLHLRDYVRKIEERASVQRALWVGKEKDKETGELKEIPALKLTASRRKFNMEFAMKTLSEHRFNPNDHWYHGRIDSEFISPLYVLSSKESGEVLLGQMKKYSFGTAYVAKEQLQQVILQMLKTNPEIAGVLKPLLEKGEKETKH